MGLRGPRKEENWPTGDFAASVIIRFLLLFVLWAFYGMVPHVLPVSSILVVVAILGAYALFLFSRKNNVIAWLILIAAGLNLLLMIAVAAANANDQIIGKYTLFIILPVYVILLFDIANVPR